MGNIVSKEGYPRVEHKIGDMCSGDVGYTVEWAIDGDNIREDYSISSKGGTANVRVECVQPHKYRIVYEGKGR